MVVQVLNVKRQIEDSQGKESFPCSQQLLIHQGKVLKDETTMEENKVSENGFVVVMLTKAKTGAGASPPSSSGTTQVHFSDALLVHHRFYVSWWLRNWPSKLSARDFYWVIWFGHVWNRHLLPWPLLPLLHLRGVLPLHHLRPRPHLLRKTSFCIIIGFGCAALHFCYMFPSMK